MKLEIVSLGVLAVPATTGVDGFNVCPTTPTTRCRTSTVTRHVLVEPDKRRLKERQFISILSLWVIEEGDPGQKRAIEVPGASEVGWVNPRSYSELWVPEDSQTPTMRLCLGMLIKDGVPRYVMPMVDLWVFKGGHKWRNRGLNTVPIAHCWEPFARAAAGGLCISAYAEEKVKERETDSMWGTLADKVPVTETLAEIVTVLADPPEGLNVKNGFHFIVAEVAGLGQMPVPACGGRVRMFLSDLPEPAELLELPEVTGVSELGFDVVAVASGAESEFMPEIYRALFSAETC